MSTCDGLHKPEVGMCMSLRIFSVFLLIIKDTIVAGKMCAKSILVEEFCRQNGLNSPEILHNQGINRKLPV